jgi:hypothetical protein
MNRTEDGGITAPYEGASDYKSWPENRAILTEVFVVFLTSFKQQIKLYLKLIHDSFLPHPFHLTFY